MDLARLTTAAEPDDEAMILNTVSFQLNETKDAIAPLTGKVSCVGGGNNVRRDVGYGIR